MLTNYIINIMEDIMEFEECIININKSILMVGSQATMERDNWYWNEDYLVGSGCNVQN